MTIMAYRDTQWLMIEACREFQRGTCKRTDTECKYAHPGSSVTVENGRVTACFDSLKVRAEKNKIIIPTNPLFPACMSFPTF